MIAKHILLTLIVPVVFGITLWKQIPPEWTAMQTAGLVLMIPGFVLWTIARFELGSSFAITAQARQLVTHGLYSKIRNPIYVFSCCILIGFVLLLGRPVLLLLLVVLIPMQTWRAKKEAAVLEAKFGDQYRRYRASTWF